MAGEKILFVDDEEQIRKLLGMFLTRRGYQVTTANNGLEAIRVLNDFTPHLIITDVNMPYVNGLELTRRLRENHKTARIPIVMLSAQKETEDILAGYTVGADEYVPKPIDMAVLAAKIEILLRRSSAAGPQRGGRRGKVVVFFRGKGGVGTSTMVVNTAVALATSATYRPVIVDLCLEFGNICQMMDVKPKRALSDLSHLAVSEIAEDALAQVMVRHKCGVSVVVGSLSPEKAELVSISLIHQVVDRLREQADLIFIDTTPSFTEVNLAALDVADSVCLVTNSHLASLKATLDCLDVLSKLQFQKGQVLVLLNRSSPSGLEFSQVVQFLGRKPDLVVPYTVLFDDAADAGNPLMTAYPASPGVMEVKDLASRIGALVNA